MNRVVVTGAGGFIGKALTKRLLDRGDIVYAVVHSADSVSEISSENLFPIECDFERYGLLSEMIPPKVDAFVHLAWKGVSGVESKNLSVQVNNIKAASSAFEQACFADAKKFLFVGSSYQYRVEPLQEGMPYVLKNIYGIAKHTCTELLKAAAIGCDITFNSVLFTNVFGVGDYSMRTTNIFISQLLKGQALRLIPGRYKHDWVYIDDAIEGMISVLEKGKNGVSYYIGERELRTFREIITDVRDVLAPKVDLLFGYYPDDGYIDYDKIDLNRLYDDTGFQCPSNWKENILQTAEWVLRMEENGTGGGYSNCILDRNTLSSETKEGRYEYSNRDWRKWVYWKSTDKDAA